MENIKNQLRDGFQQLNETLGPMQKYVTPTSALVGLGAGLSVYWLIKQSKNNLPPGPTPIPLVGNYSLMSDKDLHESCVKLSQKYGPVITIYLGMSPIVIINTIEAATEVLVKSKAEFANRVELPSGLKYSEGGKDSSLAQCTPTWKLHRKIAGSALRTYLKGGKLEEAIHGSMSQVIDLFQNIREEPFVPHAYIYLAVFNIIHGLCFHKVYKFDDARFKRLVDLDNELVATLGPGFLEDLFPVLLKNWQSSRFNKAMQLMEQLLKFLDDELQEHITSFDEAGFDTTRFTLQWFFLYIAANPEEQRIAQKEIDRVVDGYDIPKGTMVMINHWALHNDPKHWKEPSKFDPRRFFDSDGNLAPKPVSWLPFSAGMRVCLGEGVAKPQLHLICATILQKFEIMLPPGVTADFSPNNSGIAGYTANQYKIVVKKRS